MEDGLEKGKRKKLVKKAAKGEINCIEQYRTCIRHAIEARPFLDWKTDSRKDQLSGLDISVGELRDFLVTVLSDNPCRRYTAQSCQQINKHFSVQNKPFIRGVVIVHLFDDSQLSDVCKNGNPVVLLSSSSCPPNSYVVVQNYRAVSKGDYDSG